MSRGALKRAWPIWPSVISFTALAGTELLRAPKTPKQALKEAVHTTDSIAAYVMPTMVGHNDRWGSGCTQRASDLTSKQVQSYSDQELFWIIQNGIRFTGMPAFGNVETPDHVWDLVNYVRTLPGDSQKGDSTK